MSLDRPSQPNVERFAKIVVTVGLMEIGSRIRRPLFSGRNSRPAFCDWWKSSIVDNFAFNRNRSDIAPRRKSTLAFVTGNFLLRKGSIRQIRCILRLYILKSSIASKFICARGYIYVCIYVGLQVVAFVRAISVPISHSSERRLNGRACEVPQSYLCSRHTSPLLMHCPQIESGNR